MVLVRLLADAEDTTKGGTLHKKLQQAIEDQGWDPGSMQKVEQKRIPHIQFIQSISIGIEYGMFFSNLNIAYGIYGMFFFDFPTRKSWTGYKIPSWNNLNPPVQDSGWSMLI